MAKTDLDLQPSPTKTTTRKKMVRSLENLHFIANLYHWNILINSGFKSVQKIGRQAFAEKIQASFKFCAKFVSKQNQ